MTEEVDQAGRPGAEFHVLGTIERQTLLKMLAKRIDLVAGPGDRVALPADQAGWEDMSEALEQRPLKADPSTDQAGILVRAPQLLHAGSCPCRQLTQRLGARAAARCPLPTGWRRSTSARSCSARRCWCRAARR